MQRGREELEEKQNSVAEKKLLLYLSHRFLSRLRSTLSLFVLLDYMQRKPSDERRKQQRKLGNYFHPELVAMLRQRTHVGWQHKEKGASKGNKKQFHVFVPWIIELGGQIKVQFNICGVILPP